LSPKAEIPVQFAVATVIAAALLAVTSVAAPPVKNPRYATPEATLNAYVDGILAVDEDAELSTGTPEARAQAIRNRGPDRERRKKLLAGKARHFESFPLRIVQVKILGDRAKILAHQGGPPENPITYVYSFKRLNGNWKISGIDRTHDMGW